ncbi:adenylate/guanylate cyclase domain-containing protein [Denitromonas iodatirespirans]|uniref:Adenylate/guanylate cyclase domain-containing protein n=1 Tax=Denitromonas iodatirespirans TaxID=2795389 RepID=A0A944D9Y3_DENI1|nr:adenylate/guanylate cyclase domain-containing protein [Denitromonas iodatirespirans]MBT0962684.1 adenylate/guanylate cyclase domain-containing protein [Denitromonas iodatirespirans]
MDSTDELSYYAQSFATRLRNAGVRPGDDEQTRLGKSLLVFATGLMSIASGLWLLLYWLSGPKLSSTLPFLFQVLLAANLAYYIHSGNFTWFRFSQFALFLFFPFVAQWSMGNFITGSGVILWGLIAPIGAVFVMGLRESMPWFFAYVFFTALTGLFDYLLVDVSGPLDAAAAAVSLRTSVLFFALNFIAISGIVYALVRFALEEKRKLQTRLEEAMSLLRSEQERSERLLLNVLPGAVAERLKMSDETVADDFSSVSVMFADIVNFTQIASGLSAPQVFAMLNEVFCCFDALAEQRGLEKIKTIGDAYMVAGGLDGRCKDPCAAIAELALDMRDNLPRLSAKVGVPLALRIGIGTGPVVAGVVGRKKFIYDLWGDTVNVASRLSGDGAPDTIHCDRRTHMHLSQRFAFDERSILRIKGKGEVITYRLLGHMPQGSHPPHHSAAA